MKKIAIRIFRYAEFRSLSPFKRVLYVCTSLAVGVGTVEINNFVFGHKSDALTSLMRIVVSIGVGVMTPFTAGFLTGLFGPGARNPTRKLPRNARFLIMLFMANPTGDSLLGDLDERFYKIANDATQGPGRAHFWYWFQIVISLRPLAWASLKRLTGLTALYEAIRKVIK